MSPHTFPFELGHAVDIVLRDALATALRRHFSHDLYPQAALFMRAPDTPAAQKDSPAGGLPLVPVLTTKLIVSRTARVALRQTQAVSALCNALQLGETILT